MAIISPEASSLQGIAAEAKVFEPATGKDISDHLGAGNTFEQLIGGEGDCVGADTFGESAPDTGELLDSLAHTLRRFVVLSDSQRDVIALWVPHTHAIEAADTTPYINVSSAEKQSGKSRLLEVLATLVARPMEAANCSDAVLFRALASEEGPATLLYDEIDAIFGKNATPSKEEQRGLLNAGYRRGAVAWRCEGEGSKQIVKPYPVFGAKAFAGIGDLPETLADRSVPIRLRRRRPDEQIERARRRDILAACQPLHAECARWANLNQAQLEGREPDLPDELSDREQDGAEPLIAIADLAGGEWPERARAALIELHAGKSDESESWGVVLLTDIRKVIREDEERIGTTDLLHRLKEDEEGPWGAWGKGLDGLNPRGLAKLLKPYGIHRKTFRIGDEVQKGYELADLGDAWDRYLPPIPTLSGNKGNNGSVEPETGGSLSVTEMRLLPQENGRKPLEQANVTDVTAENPDRREISGSGGCVSHPDGPASGCSYCAKTEVAS